MTGETLAAIVGTTLLLVEIGACLAMAVVATVHHQQFMREHRKAMEYWERRLEKLRR